MGILRRNGHVAHEHPPEAAAAPVVPEGVEVQPAPAWVAEAPAWVAAFRLEVLSELELHLCDGLRAMRAETTERDEAQATRIDRIAKRADRIWGAVERLEHFGLEHTPDYVRSQTERPPAQLDGLRRTIRDAEEQTRPVAPATTEEDT
jgi:hypothetical protein